MANSNTFHPAQGAKKVANVFVSFISTWVRVSKYFCPVL